MASLPALQLRGEYDAPRWEFGPSLGHSSANLIASFPGTGGQEGRGGEGGEGSTDRASDLETWLVLLRWKEGADDMPLSMKFILIRN